MKQLLIYTLAVCVVAGIPASAQKPSVGPNVNMLTGTKLGDGDPFATKQNEVSLAISALNPDHLMGASNDYRLVAYSQLADIPGEVGSGDAWIGLYYSVDKGLTWRSTVLSGCPLNIPACNNPLMAGLKGRVFAADPTIRSTPYGGYLLSFIAGNRDSAANGIIGVARFFDRPDILKAGDIPYTQVDPYFEIDRGTTGQMKDKSWLAVDEPGRPGSTGTCVIPGFANPVPAFSAYVSFSNFVGQSGDNPHPQILVARSTDCGKTFSKPVKVSQSVATNSGSVVSVDPNNGDVYVIWRQFYTASNGDPDALYFAKSTDGGQKFSAPKLIATFPPFDQGTGPAQFRTNAFPTMAVSVDRLGKSRIHVAFSGRKGGPDGDARIMLTTSSDGGNTWPAPAAVDDWVSDPLLETVPLPNRNPGRGHQFQPTMTAAGGKLAIGWFDQRYDHTIGVLKCPAGATCTSMKDYREHREPAGNLAGTAPQFDKVFTKYLTDSTPGLTRKHSIDFFSALADPADQPVFTSSRVSQYRFGSAKLDPLKKIIQTEYNVPNRPIFVNNSASFIGDYAEVAASQFVPTGDAARPYRFNTSFTDKTIFHAAWTDNRKVVPPRNGDWNSRTPISVLVTNPDGSIGVQKNASCAVGQEGTQNQEIFTAQFGEPTAGFSPVNSKRLNSSVPRGFVVGVQNLSETKTTYRLRIANQPPGPGSASFLQSLVAQAEIQVDVLPRSSATRTVWVTSPFANTAINVDVLDASGLTKLTTIRLNPDPNAPLAGTADGSANDTSNNDMSDVRVKELQLTNTELTNTELTNTELTNTELTNTELTNTELTNTELTNTELTNTELTNTELTNTELTNTELTNTELTNTELTNNNFQNTELTNSPFADAKFNVANNGNVDTALSLKTLLRGNQVPAGYKLQMVVRRIAISQYPRGCQFLLSQQNAQLLNVPSPLITSPTDPTLGTFVATDSSETNATLPLLAGERAQVVVRIIGPSGESARQFAENALKLVGAGADGSRTVVPLIIKTLALPVITAGASFTYTLESFGGYQSKTWSAQDGYPLPSWLTLNAQTGVLSGTPPAAASYTLKIAVSDQSIPGQTDKQTLILVVNLAPQTVTITGVPTSPKTYGDPPFAVNANSTSGQPVTVNGAGACSASGNLVSISSAGTCDVTASQAGNGVYAPATTTQSFSVLKAAQTITFPAISTRTYGDPAFSAGASASSSLPVTLSASGACSVVAGTVTILGAGSCTVTASQSGDFNYNGAVDAARTFTIDPAALTATANSASRAYGAPNPLFSGTLSGVVNGDNISATYSSAASNTSPAGDYPIEAVLADPQGKLPNYQVTLNAGVLTVGKAGVTIAAANAQRAYGSANPASFSGTINGLLNGDVLSVSYSTAATQASDVGQYPIVPGAVSANYIITAVNGSLTVTPAPLNVVASNAAKVYGDPLPAFGATYSGFVLGQGPGALGGALALTTTATATSPAGSYFIVPSGLTSTNYTIGFVPGALTVVKATPVFSNLTAPTIAPATASVTLSGKIALAALIPGGSVNITLNGVTQPAPISADGSFSANLPAASLTPGSYPAAYAYPGDTNFVPVNASTTVKVEGWVSAGNMLQARSVHQAVKLADGTILLTGGNTSQGSTATAELYDPATGRTTAVGNLPNKAAGHTATLLANGKVLIAGGGNSASELYDPVGRTFSSSGGMSSQRSFHTATRLASGLVLITGGQDNSGNAQSTALLFNPATGNFESTGVMRAARMNHSATLLADGRVLLAGGRQKSGGGFTYLASAEVYNPAAKTFTSVGNMTAARASHAQALINGKVLILGGRVAAGSLASAESFDPATGLFTPAGNLAAARHDHTATLLAGGRLLIAGGTGGATQLNSAEFLSNAVFSAAPPLTGARAQHTAILLNDGRVLVTGGSGATGVPVASMELFTTP